MALQRGLELTAVTQGWRPLLEICICQENLPSQLCLYSFQLEVSPQSILRPELDEEKSNTRTSSRCGRVSGSSSAGQPGSCLPAITMISPPLAVSWEQGGYFSKIPTPPSLMNVIHFKKYVCLHYKMQAVDCCLNENLHTAMQASCRTGMDGPPASLLPATGQVRCR